MVNPAQAFLTLMNLAQRVFWSCRLHRRFAGKTHEIFRLDEVACTAQNFFNQSLVDFDVALLFHTDPDLLPV